jgi:hypothetical protein
MELAGLERIFGGLGEAGVEYLVVGGLAVNAHGYVRATMDVDLVVALRPANLKKALSVLSKAGYRPAIPVRLQEFAKEANRKKWLEEKGFRVLRLHSGVYPLTPLDLFSYEPFDFAAEHRRAARVPLGKGVRVPIVNLETLLAMKREAGRPRDLADVAELERLRRSGDA